MNTRISHYVRSKLLEALPEGAARQAIDTLADTRFPLAEPGSVLEERIHLGIVKLVCDPRSSDRAEPRAQQKFESAASSLARCRPSALSVCKRFDGSDDAMSQLDDPTALVPIEGILWYR